MKESEFKKLCPGLYSDMQKSMKIFEIYGIKYKRHCEFLPGTFEGGRGSYIEYYEFKINGEKPRCYDTPPYNIVLN